MKKVFMRILPAMMLILALVIACNQPTVTPPPVTPPSQPGDGTDPGTDPEPPVAVTDVTLDKNILPLHSDKTQR